MSSFEIESLECVDLAEPSQQLGIILYPPELLNEKFLIKMRDCVLKLPDSHPVKKWLKWISTPKKPTKKEEETRGFLMEIMNSKFNLITDLKVKTKIIETLAEIKGDSLTEKILKSYLYLLVGNITRSDNVMRDIIKTPPSKLWRAHHKKSYSFFDVMARENLEQILERLSRHPSDRKMQNLFVAYLSAFSNDPGLKEILADIDISGLDGTLSLKYIEHIAPDFIHFLRLSKLEVSRRNQRLQKMDWFDTKGKAYWIWPFLETDSSVSVEMAKELKAFEKEDHLWFIYVMHDERMADSFQKKNNQSFLPGRRQYLRSLLEKPETFMLGLFKIIEFGDIDSELVHKTLDYITRD